MSSRRRSPTCGRTTRACRVGASLKLSCQGRRNKAEPYKPLVRLWGRRPSPGLDNAQNERLLYRQGVARASNKLPRKGSGTSDKAPIDIQQRLKAHVAAHQSCAYYLEQVIAFPGRQ